MKAAYLRRIAQRCRRLLSAAIKPAAREQLRMWMSELNKTADRLEARRRRRTAAPDRC